MHQMAIKFCICDSGVVSFYFGLIPQWYDSVTHSVVVFFALDVLCCVVNRLCIRVTQSCLIQSGSSLLFLGNQESLLTCPYRTSQASSNPSCPD